MSAVYLTEEGYRKLIEKISQLETIERPSISKQIGEARDKGDLSENAEYDAAKEAQGLLELKIAKLKEQLVDFRIIDESKLNTDSVQILSKVTIKNLKTNKEMTYTLVSEAEANLREGKMAISTPIATALLGKAKGDIAKVKAPSGTIELEIIDISL